jgi:murein DD-endopeptidase MepM/ murein hydrolase activator NlpD
LNNKMPRAPLLIVLALLATTAPQPAAAEPDAASTFQAPLPSWDPHCLSFGSEWRYCDGTVIRDCPGGAVWRHTGVDITTGIQPVAAAADGEIAGYLVDPTFRGGMLIRHQVPGLGTVITQYWHVWPRPGFAPGTHVSRGEIFADVADMGARTHLHFAVFIGEIDANAWRGALPPAPCEGTPAFPYRFVDPNRFLLEHQPEAQVPVGPGLARPACWRCW